MSYLPRIAESFQALSLNKQELAYYARHILLPGVGLEGQLKLKVARVAVIGAGGLGCPVLQALAGAGVGHLTVVDGDQVSLSNLSRQWLHTYAGVGRNKADSAREQIEAFNPCIQIKAVSEMLTADNARVILDSCDLVVDATDDLEVRYLIDDVCAELRRPWVHAALYRDSAQMTVFWKQCSATFRELYPEPSGAPSCSGAGMLGASASLVGNLQALEAIKLITGNGHPKVGELVSINSQTVSVRTFKLPDVSAPSVYLAVKETGSERAISASELKQAFSIHEPITVVDLRKSPERAIESAIHLSEESVLENGIPHELSGKVVLVCEEGAISSMLCAALLTFDDRIYHLEGGASTLEQLL